MFQIFTDQMQRVVQVPANVERIISLVPSQTELLFDLGLGEKVVGVSKFCIHPRELVKNKVKIGGTKKFDFEKITSLNPDLIIGNKEENYKEGIEELAQTYPVWMSDIFTLSDALDMIESIGEITKTSTKAKEITKQISLGFNALEISEKNVKVLYLIWRKPYMGVGSQTFIHEMLTTIGFENVLVNEVRYPELSVERMKELNPDYIFLSSEPFPFQEKHQWEFKEEIPDIPTVLVDGEMFSWPGSHLLQATSYFQELLAQLSV